MDTSKDYYEKCKKAKKVQEAWSPTPGDWVWSSYAHRAGILTRMSVTHGGTVEIQWAAPFILPDDISLIRRGTWLPTQGQLQKMVKRVSTDSTLSIFINWWEQKEDTWCQFSTSMEQLWLAFVMKENFNEEWRDGTWKKVS